MQFNVPQFIETEDKIIGPLTLKQFMLLLAGGVLVLFAWYFFKLWFVAVLAVFLAAFLGAIIFVKINGRPFITFLVSLIGFTARPKIYIWKRKSASRT